MVGDKESMFPGRVMAFWRSGSRVGELCAEGEGNYFL